MDFQTDLQQCQEREMIKIHMQMMTHERWLLVIGHTTSLSPFDHPFSTFLPSFLTLLMHMFI